LLALEESMKDNNLVRKKHNKQKQHNINTQTHTKNKHKHVK